jgi:hypothetical protein
MPVLPVSLLKLICEALIYAPVLRLVLALLGLLILGVVLPQYTPTF